MKTGIHLLIGVLGLTSIISLPAIAQPTRVEDFFNSVPGRGNETFGPLNQTGDEQAPSYNRALDSRQMTTAANSTLLDRAASNNQFKLLAMAVQAAGLSDTLKAEGPFTIFAPTDKAFAALSPQTVDKLLNPENRDLLRQVLAYHVVRGKVTSSALKSGQIETLAGKAVAVQVNSSGGVTVNNANVTQANISASNGVIHAIDQVILPPQIQAQIDLAPATQKTNPAL